MDNNLCEVSSDSEDNMDAISTSIAPWINSIDESREIEKLIVAIATVDKMDSESSFVDNLLVRNMVIKNPCIRQEVFSIMSTRNGIQSSADYKRYFEKLEQKLTKAAYIKNILEETRQGMKAKLEAKSEIFQLCHRYSSPSSYRHRNFTRITSPLALPSKKRACRQEGDNENPAKKIKYTVL